MTDVIVRFVLVAVCAVVGVRLLVVAGIRRRAWRRLEAHLNTAEAWWDKTQQAPFDQARPGIPENLEPYLSAAGPRRDLHTPAPALAQLVWGWLLLALWALLALTALAQLASGTH